MQLHAVEAGLAGAPRGVGEEAREHSGQFAHVRQVRVRDALAVAEAQRLKLALVEHALNYVFARALQKLAHLTLVSHKPTLVLAQLGERAPVSVAHN